MIERTIKLGPVRTRYFEAGDSSAPAVVLIHEGGFGSDAPNTFDRLVAELESDHHLLLPEMLGFGGTDKAVFFGEGPYEPRLRHLSSFLDALDVREAHFVGNSFGGGMVLRMSIRPDTAWRMRSATSISGSGGPYRTAEAIDYTGSYTPTLSEARRVDEWVLAPVDADEEHSLARFESSLRPGQWESMMSHTLRSPINEDSGSSDGYPATLSISRVPTLLMAGAYDPIFEHGWEDHIASHLNDVKVARLNLGHAPNITHPRETAQILRDFFQDISVRETSAPSYEG